MIANVTLFTFFRDEYKLMETQVVYGFETAQVANRFLNALKNWSVAEVDAKFFRGNKMVKVTYQYGDTGFDKTCSELDDLADRYEGTEIPLR